MYVTGQQVFEKIHVCDRTAGVRKEVCHDVAVDPILQPLTGEIFKYKMAKNVSVRSFWNKGQRAFCDVRVFDPSTPRLLNMSLGTAYSEQEQEKRRGYNQRVI